MTHQNHSKSLVLGQNIDNDLPKPPKLLGFGSKVMDNDPPKPLKSIGFQSKVIDLIHFGGVTAIYTVMLSVALTSLVSFH